MEPGNLWLLAAIAVLSFVLSFVGASVGLVLGHLRLPLLIAYLGGSTAAGAACNLIISGVGALAGTVNHVRAGRVSWGSLVLLGVPSAVGAVVGALLVVHVNRLWSYLVIGALLVVSGLLLLRRPPQEAPAAPAPTGPWKWVVEVVIGLGLGVLAAVTGLMLGSLRLPVMLRLYRLDLRVAIGTNMAVGCLTALVGSVVGFFASQEVAWSNLVWVLVAVAPPTALGGYLGGWLTGYLRQETVRALAGWVVAFSGVLMIAQAAESLRRHTPVTAAEFLEADADPEYDWDDFDFDDD